MTTTTTSTTTSIATSTTTSSTTSNKTEPEWQQRPSPHPRLSYITPNPPLVGQSLYLGGEIGPDGNIYCIPGHASHVLTIRPNKKMKNDDDGDDCDVEVDECQQIGPKYEGKFKWLRGIKACNDIIYGLQCHADSILRIDARGREGQSVVVDDEDDNSGGGDDVHISTIPIPYQDYFDTEEEAKMEKEMIWKYHGGVISPIDNCIYCIPQSGK
jgi:hypothetical protein